MSERDTTTDEQATLAEPDRALEPSVPEPAPSRATAEPALSSTAPADGTDGLLRRAAPEPGGARRPWGSRPKITYKRPSGRREPGASGKRKTNLILGVVAFFVVAGTAIALSLSSGGSRAGGPPTTGTIVASPVSFRYRTASPPQIGTWSKLDDQSPVEQFRTEVAQGGVQQPYAVIYTDPASTSAIAWGGVGTPYVKGSPDSRLSAFFATASRNVGGGSAGPRIDVDPGALGGKAQCASVLGVGISMVVCGWTGDGALMGFEFSAGTLEQNQPQMKSMLAAIVLPAGSD